MIELQLPKQRKQHQQSLDIKLQKTFSDQIEYTRKLDRNLRTKSFMKDQQPTLSTKKITKMVSLTQDQNLLQHQHLTQQQRTLLTKVLKKQCFETEQENNKSIKSFQSKLTRGLSLIDENGWFYQSIEFTSFFVWLILLVNSFSNALVPCWMTVDVQCQGITRSAWRIFIMNILLIPFVMYEQRNITDPKYKFKALLNRQNLQKYFICSINYSIWVLIGVMAIKLTARTHSFCFLRLKFFFISIGKFIKKQKYHQSEMGGVLLVSVGMLMMLWESISLPYQQDKLALYLSYSPWNRIAGDLFAILGSVVILFFDTHYQMPKNPQFSSLFLYNSCITINLIVCGYFFGGNEFSFNPERGVMGLFTEKHFVSVFYVSIMLGVNLMIGNILVNSIFSQFIRNVASCFEPIIMTAIYHFFSIQVLRSGLTCLGFSFLIPGMMLIIGGQNYLQNRQLHINFQLYKEQEINLINSTKLLDKLFMKKTQDQFDENMEEEKVKVQ